jgi:hypothetical protein
MDHRKNNIQHKLPIYFQYYRFYELYKETMTPESTYLYPEL